ncbi:porin [Amorphus sp. 3PC139-8]|uniref:porin n=1 Tax=Amorphus sp. 3PC139-8 TaxID=2735676 RepID=UPI00345DBA91
MKSLLLGSAAGVLAVTGAQAADLPVAPEPIDYVRVCDAFGAGYYYIPGTDTCLSVRGRVRAEYRYFDSEYVTHWRDYDSTQFRARGYLYMDSRTNTEFGLLRAYNEVWVTTDSPGGTNLSLWNSFIQFGGFTFGKTQSFYDFVVYPTWAWYLTPQVSDQRQLMAAYTFAFGNGFSSSISLESADERRTDIVGYGYGYGGTKYPDLVANLRIDQGWGSAQLSGALHQVWPGYNPAASTPGSEVGWAINGGVKFNLPFAAGATANLSGAYTQGAVAYASSSVSVPLFAGDASFNPVSGDLDLSTAWSVSGGLGFSFTPTVGAAIQAGYLSYEDGYYDVNDFQNIDVQGNITWTPVSGLLIGTEVDYRYVDADSGSGVDDGSIWGAAFRVQRTF